jgi:hypothetical protein
MVAKSVIVLVASAFITGALWERRRYAGTDNVQLCAGRRQRALGLPVTKHFRPSASKLFTRDEARRIAADGLGRRESPRHENSPGGM